MSSWEKPVSNPEPHPIAAPLPHYAESLWRARLRRYAESLWRARLYEASDQNIIVAAKGGGIAFVGNLSVYVFRFGFGIVLARFLGPDLLGLYTLGLTIAEIAAGVSLLGLNTGTTRYVAIAASRKDTARLWGTIQTGAGLSTSIGLILAAGVFLLAGPLSYQVFHRPDLAPVLRLASLSIPLFNLGDVLASVTQGFKRMEYKVYGQDVVPNLLKFVLSIVLIGLGLSVGGAMAAYVVALAVAVVMLLYFVHRLFPLNRPLNPAKRNIREMLGFTLPLYLSALLNRFSGSIETLMLGYFGVMSGVGIYTAALRLSDVGLMFHRALQEIAVPMISDLHDRRELDQLARLYRTATRWGMTFNLPVFLTLALLAKPLLSIFGDEFVTGATGLVILAFNTLFNASTGVCGSMITMTGHSRLTLVNSIVHLVSSILLDVLLIPRWGSVGAALAVTLSGVMVNTLRTVEVLVLLHIWPYDRSFVKPIVASLAGAGAAYLISRRVALLPALIQVIVGGIVLWGVYSLVIGILRLSQEDHLVLGRLRTRLSPR